MFFARAWVPPRGTSGMWGAAFMRSNRLWTGISRLFCSAESQILLLLLGGSKRGQDRDIRTAKQYWRNYLEKNTKL